MAKKLNNVLGVDIGCRTIKVAEVRAQGREPMVSAMGLVETPVGAVDHTGIQNPDAVGAAIKQCAHDCGATITDAVVSINGQASVLVKCLEVPRMSKDELEQHMGWEIQNQSPFAESTILSDYRQMDEEDPASANIDVVMAAAPQSAIDTMVSCFKRAGKKLGAIDVPPLSYARSLASSYADAVENETVCLVDIGHKTTSINIYKDGKLLWPRQVPLGGENFTQAIADAFGISLEDAEQKKFASASIPAGAGAQAAAPVNPFADSSSNYSGYAFGNDPPPVAGSEATQMGSAPYNPFMDDASAQPAPAADSGSVPPVSDAPTEPPVSDAATVPPVTAAESVPPVSATPVPQQNPDEVALYNAFANTLSEFLDELRRSIDFYRSRGGSVERVFLAGGGAKIKGMAEYVNEAIGLPCDLYDPTRRLNVNVRKVAPDFVDSNKEQFCVAVGNGLYGFFE